MNEKGESILEHLHIQEEEVTEYNGANNASTYSNDYKICPQCGQGLIPFKYGLCICGKQVGFRKFLVNGGDSYFGRL